MKSSDAKYIVGTLFLLVSTVSEKGSISGLLGAINCVLWYGCAILAQIDESKKKP